MLGSDNVNLGLYSEEVKRASYAGMAWIGRSFLLYLILDFKHLLPSLSLVSDTWRGLSLVSQACVVVIGTGLLGWLLNIVLVLCSGPLCVA
jgi:hypothetical protein